jgi:hypothetical protein
VTGVLGDQLDPGCVERLGFWDIDGDSLFILCCCCIGNPSRYQRPKSYVAMSR